MLRFPPALSLLAAIAIAASAPAAAADAEFVPKPDTYICPNATGGPVHCYLDAIPHLYTMCRHIKGIEVVEFGYPKSEEGVNGAKTAYCLDKHQQSIQRPMQSALRETGGNRSAADAIRALHARWLAALADLKWKPGESDAQYKERVARPYDEFRRMADVVHEALAKPRVPTAAGNHGTTASSGRAANTAAAGDAAATPSASSSPRAATVAGQTPR